MALLSVISMHNNFIYWFQQAQEACMNLWLNKLRASLAILGMLVGTASVVAMVSCGQLATAQALAQFQQLGTDLLSISFYQSADAKQNNLSQHLSLIQISEMPFKIKAVKAISGYTTTFVPVTYGGNKINAAIVGADTQLENILKIYSSNGRILTIFDKKTMYCVLGNAIAKQLRKNGLQSLIGTQIKLNNSYFTIVGIAKKWQENNFFNQDINHAIVIPIQSSLRLSKYIEINHLILKLYKNTNLALVQKKIRIYINRRLPEQQYYFQSARKLVLSMVNQKKILTLMLGLIGSISLLVGGIGIMNVMLVSMVERRSEIGLRKAIGAKNKDIQILFLIESIILSLMGGILGIILGVLVTSLIALFAKWTFQFLLLPIFVGFFISVMVGIFFGFYPAYQAAQLQPIQTLRM